MLNIGTDFHDWLLDQVAALRSHDSELLDWDHLAEEIESMAARERREMMAESEVRLSDRAQRELDDAFEADKRVWQLMDIITAEFKSDPTSGQCFDLRIVREAIDLVAKRKAMKDTFNPFKRS